MVRTLGAGHVSGGAGRRPLILSVPPARPSFSGPPAVDGATLRVRGGEFRITAADNSPENIYIQRITLNGEAYRKYYIDYAEIAAGGELRFEMGPEPADWTKQQPL